LNTVGTTDLQVVWFKRDLRVRDNEALSRAAENGPVLPLYIVEPALWRLPDAAAQHWDVISRSLAELRESLGALGSPLVVRTGPAKDVLQQIHTSTSGIAHLWAHEETSNDFSYQRDREVRRWARSVGIRLTELPHDFVVRRLTSRDDWSTVARERMSKPLVRAPLTIARPQAKDGLPIEPGPIPKLRDLGLTPDAPVGCSEAGERAGRATLKSFLEVRSAGYERRLSSPITAWDGCSRLSTHLTYGTISLREVLARTQREAGANPARRFSLKAFEERLHWRSHFVQKLEDQPSLEKHSYIPGFDELRLDPATSALGAERFEAWRTGTTGFPMVDACMRSLNERGWINFRMRAMLVSFASYDLWLDWRVTSQFLARAFVDYEPGIHYPQFQMQSGTTGINTIRIYDPVKQGLDHDPTGEFVRQWVPELGGVGDGAVHQPWLLGDTLFGAPTGYPAPIVNHADAVAFAWAQVDRLKGDARRNGTAAAIVEQHGSRRPPPAVRRSSKSRRR
jgi:deoxyribodipyrimidine photo-lyase